MGLKRLKSIDLGAKFGYNYKYRPKLNPFRIIEISAASVAHPYQKYGKLPPDFYYNIYCVSFVTSALPNVQEIPASGD